MTVCHPSRYKSRARIVVIVVRGERVSEVLSRSKAASALLALLDNGPIGMTALEDEMGGYKGSARPLVYLFRDAGLVTVHEEEGQFKKPVYEIVLTPKGQRFAKLVDDLVSILPDDEPPKRKR